MKLSLFIFLLLFISGCAGLDKNNQVIDQKSEKQYLYDLRMKVNGVWYIGFGLPEPQKSYMIEIEPPGDKIDRLIITTCHRQDVIDKPDNVGWLKKSVLYSYSHDSEVEGNRTCPMHIYALEEKSRALGFGFLDFVDNRSEYDLSLRAQCNGKESFFKGRGFCQSAMDLIQVLNFYEPVIVSPLSQSPECLVFDSKPQKVFEFKMPKGACTYQFVSKYKSKNGLRSRLRFYTFGVTDVPVRF